jgi:hypothetical protein
LPRRPDPVFLIYFQAREPFCRSHVSYLQVAGFRHLTGERLMFYRKNIYSWEQALRIAGGLALVIVPALTMQGGTWSYYLMAAGAGIGLTGILGFCPMCAMAGRRISTAKPKAANESN